MSCSGALFAEESEQGNGYVLCVSVYWRWSERELGKIWCVRDRKPETGGRGLTCDPPSVLEKQSCGLSFTQTPEVWVFLHIKRFCRTSWAPWGLTSDPRGWGHSPHCCACFPADADPKVVVYFSDSLAFHRKCLFEPSLEVVVYSLSRVWLLPLHGLQPTRTLCPWDAQTRMLEWVSSSFSGGLSDPSLLHCRCTLYRLSLQGSSRLQLIP